jgi:hypothetical protein
VDAKKLRCCSRKPSSRAIASARAAVVATASLLVLPKHLPMAVTASRVACSLAKISLIASRMLTRSSSDFARPSHSDSGSKLDTPSSTKSASGCAYIAGWSSGEILPSAVSTCSVKRA